MFTIDKTLDSGAVRFIIGLGSMEIPLLFRSGTEVISTVMFSFYSNGRLPFVAAISVGLWVAGMVLMVILRFVLKARISF